MSLAVPSGLSRFLLLKRGAKAFLTAVQYIPPTNIAITAFDDQSIAYSQNLKLVMRSPDRHPANPVVARGDVGSVDAMGVQFYGSVIREADKYRLWYVAYDDDTDNSLTYSRWRAAYGACENSGAGEIARTAVRT